MWKEFFEESEVSEREKRDLIGKAKQGDKKAKEKLIKIDFPLIHKFSTEVCKFINNFDHFEDVIQYMIEKYLLAFEKFDPLSTTKLSTYVYQRLVWSKEEYIRRHHSIFTTKKNMTEAVEYKISSLHETPVELKEQGFEEELLNKITTEQIEKIIHKEITNNKLKYIVLERFRGKTYKEIGKKLGISRQRVKQILDENREALERLIKLIT